MAYAPYKFDYAGFVKTAPQEMLGHPEYPGSPHEPSICLK